MSDLVFPNLLDQLSSDLVKDNVSIIEFCESSDYCNKPLYPRQRVLMKLMFLEELDGYEEDVLSEWIQISEDQGDIRISPKIRDRVEWLRENDYPHFSLVQLVGGRRSGKGHMTGAAIAYKAYKLTQLNNPGAFFGIESGKDIYFTIVADSLDQAKAYQFKDARNWILDCQPLMSKGLVGEPLAESIAIATPYDLARMAATGADHNTLATLRVKAFPKNAGSIRGSASIVVVIDEMAHIMGGESHISDVELYTAVRPALQQFKKDALMFANSSPWTKQGMFYELYRRSVGDKALDGERIQFPTYFSLQYPSWEMYKDWERDRRFSGAVMLPPEEDIAAALEEKGDPDKFRVEYRAQFGEVVDAFLSPEMVERMFDPNNQIETIGKRLITQPGGTIAYARYKGHGDPSSRNANFGIAVGHVEMHSGFDPILNEMVEQPHVVFDYVNAFFPEQFEDNGGTIDWLTVLPTIEEIINNFRPESWTFDQFESDAPIQLLNDRLRRRGLQPIVFEIKATVPHNKRRAQNFKQALYLNRVHAPHPEGQSNEKALDLVRNELKFLQEKNGRVDHQTTGPIKTKDIADCVMEIVDQLIGDVVGGPDLGEGIDMVTHSGYGGQGGYTTSQGTPFEQLYSGIHRATPRGGIRVPGRGISRRRY
jgi:hypothetical protein